MKIVRISSFRGNLFTPSEIHVFYYWKLAAFRLLPGKSSHPTNLEPLFLRGGNFRFFTRQNPKTIRGKKVFRTRESVSTRCQCLLLPPDGMVVINRFNFRNCRLLCEVGKGRWFWGKRKSSLEWKRAFKFQLI